MANPTQFAKNLVKKSLGTVPPSPRMLIDLGFRAARRTLGLMPKSSGRFSGKLAKDGGMPVRDVLFHPWPQFPKTGILDWTCGAGLTLGRIFRSGVEGLPQPLAALFSAQWAEYCGVSYALLLPHGTDALRTSLAAVLDHDGLAYGGEIIVPNLTFIASANACLDRRFGVAFVDVDPDTLNIDPRRIEDAIIPGRTRAIMAVHLFGQPADMTALRAIAKKHSLALIEDAAQAHGALHELGRTGSIGEAAAFSFQSSKNLPAGEGGALTTNDPEIFDRAYSFHNVGRSRTKGARWSHEALGWNCRPNEYLAAVLLHRFRTFEAEQELRAVRFGQLRQLLEDVPGIKPLAIGAGVRRHGVHMFVMRYQADQCGGIALADFMRAVRAEGIPLDRAYDMTVTQQVAMQRLAEKRPEYIRGLPTPIADQAVNEIVFLPHFLFLGGEADLQDIAAAFRKVQAHYGEARQSTGLTRVAAAAAPLTPVAPSFVTKTIRIGIIGMGVMGRQHATVIRKTRKFSLDGVTDLQPAAAQKAAADYACRSFATPEEMMRYGKLDAVVIATPHWSHGELAIAAFAAGLHVVCEKPLTVTVEQADAVLAEAAKSDRLFAAVHQSRFEPVYQFAKQVLDRGELGPILRCSMVETAWRTQAYYLSNPWRGTWRGEGGGVLLNQAPHLLDRYAWLCGMPTELSAFCDTTLHQIEVEDNVSAILRHANGAQGFIHVNTIESPPISQTVIVGDCGRLVIEDGKVHITKLRGSLREQTATNPRLWYEVENETRTIVLSQIGSPQELLHPFYENFLAVANGTGQLACPGAEARDAVELANAMLLSSARRQTVTLPVPRDEYTRWIGEKVESSSS
jgi:dTDP-4-amino-4,6-dideoxygalactose transaminase/predicted dehydrogenase